MLQHFYVANYKCVLLLQNVGHSIKAPAKMEFTFDMQMRFNHHIRYHKKRPD